jgi:hypothetical protein
MLLHWPLGLLLVAHAHGHGHAQAPRPGPEDDAEPSPTAPDGGCPADARVEVNLAAWRASLFQADSSMRRDDVLGELKLALDVPEPEPHEGRAPRISLVGVDDMAAQLGPGRPDHVVQIRYEVESPDDKATIYLVQVLRPLEGRHFCALGTELSRRDDGAKKLETFRLSFVPLLDAHAKAIEVERAESELRRNDLYREYWVAHGFALRKVFDEKIGSMSSPDRGDGVGAGTITMVGKLVLAGGFPRRVELTAVTKRGGCEVGAGDTPCDDSEPSTSSTFVYDGSKYVRKR